MDTLRALLGVGFASRVYRYNPKVLYFASEVFVIGSDYFDHVDNLARESASAIRNVFQRFPHGSGAFPQQKPPMPRRLPTALVLNRAETQTRGRSWANFNEVLRLIHEEIGSHYAVQPYICGDKTFQSQVVDFSETAMV